MGVEFERFCCVNLAIAKTQTIDDILMHIKPCFAGLNKTNKDQISFAIKYHMTSEKSPYDLSQCNIEERCSDSTSSPYVVYVCVWVVIMVAIIISNLIVLAAMQNTHFTRYHVTNLFISSLAASDLLIGIFIIPIKIRFAFNMLRFCMGKTVCRFYISVDNTLFTVSITNLFVICIDRYLALNYPYMYPTWVTKKRCWYTVMFIWLYGVTWGILANLKWDDIYLPAVDIRDLQCQNNSNYIYATVAIIVVFFIPVILMGVLYFKIHSLARKHASNISKERSYELKNACRYISNGKNSKMVQICEQLHRFPNIANNKHMSLKEIQLPFYRKMVFKATKTVAILYGTFVVSWLPLSCLSLVLSYSSEHFKEIDFKVFYVIFVEMLPILNSLANPFVYAVTNKQYRAAFKKVLQNVKKKFIGN